MAWTSIVAVYFLFWVACAFLMLPFGVRTPDEAGERKVPGQADSAPIDFRPGRVALRATLLAAAVTALWVANWNNQWITVGDLNWWGGPPQIDEFSTARPKLPPSGRGG